MMLMPDSKRIASLLLSRQAPVSEKMEEVVETDKTDYKLAQEDVMKRFAGAIERKDYMAMFAAFKDMMEICKASESDED